MSEGLPRRYRYSYELKTRFGHWEHVYLLVGARGAIHFHVTDYGKDGEHNKAFVDRYSGGIEVHYRTPPDPECGPPDHDKCEFLGGSPCWHDGSSMQAKERLIPFWSRDPSNHEAMFRYLVCDADAHLAINIALQKDGGKG